MPVSNAYLLAKFRFGTAENEPAKNLQNFANFPNFANSKVTQLVASIPGLTVSKLPDGRNRMTVAADDAAFHAALRRS